MLASTDPEGQVNDPPAGLVTVFPFSLVWLSPVLGVAVAAPSVRVQEPDVTSPFRVDVEENPKSPVTALMIASTMR